MTCESDGRYWITEHFDSNIGNDIQLRNAT